MTVQITIIGMGQIGTSLGLALSGKENLIRRVGHDRDLAKARRAEKMGAVDQVELNLPHSVEKADLVILALPLDQIRETLGYIGPDLREDAVIMDTSTAKGTVASWMKELLPPRRHYVGLTPVLSAHYLHDMDSGIDAARDDLFRGGMMVIVSPPGTNAEAVKLAADLTRLVDASPLFADLAEVDGLMAATHLLPQLSAAALLNATIDRPGWREGRKLAGRAYAEATSAIVHLDQAQSLALSALMNRENALRVLDGMIAALHAVRSDIEARDEDALTERLSRARQGRENWWKERQAGEWTGDGGPPVSNVETIGVMDRLFGTFWKQKSKKS